MSFINAATSNSQVAGGVDDKRFSDLRKCRWISFDSLMITNETTKRAVL